MSWTDERIEQLRSMWEKGLTASQIADELGGVSRNAVIGKAHRLGLEQRPSPVKPGDEKEVKKATPCSFCHKNLQIPPDHRQPTFLREHGAMANKDLERCNSCHYAFNDQQLLKIGSNITASSYAVNNIWCKTCHNLPADKRSMELIRKKIN